MHLSSLASFVQEITLLDIIGNYTIRPSTTLPPEPTTTNPTTEYPIIITTQSPTTTEGLTPCPVIISTCDECRNLEILSEKSEETEKKKIVTTFYKRVSVIDK